MKTSLLVVSAVVALLVAGSFATEALAAPTPTPAYYTNAHTFAGDVTIAGRLAFASTVDFTSSSGGLALSSAITVTGAAVGDSCSLGAPAAAQALLGTFGCRVTAANEVKVWFVPASMISTTCTLGGESPSVCPAQTVVAASVCNCSNVGTTAAIAAAGCAVSLSGTTLTITSLNGGTHVVNYTCRAPIDPASGSFEGFVTHN